MYLVVDRFGSHGSVYRETEVERTDFETILGDLLSGEFNDPVRVIAFNTLEYWADDVSKQVADEIQTRCDIGGLPVPGHVRHVRYTPNPVISRCNNRGNVPSFIQQQRSLRAFMLDTKRWISSARFSQPGRLSHGGM